MVDFKEDAWLYALIAGILAIIGILVPWDSVPLFFGLEQYNWLEGFVSNIDGDWIGAKGLNLWTLGLTAFSIAVLLIYSINTWKGQEFKWDWLMYILTGIVLVLFPILTLVLEGTEASIYGSILVIISGIFAIGAFVVDKFIGRE